MVDSIRDALASAIDEFETRAPDEGQEVETQAEAEQRLRDEKGRFAAKAADEAPAEPVEDAAPKAKADDQAEPVEPTEPTEQKAADPSEPPQHWSDADKAWLKGLPSEHQASVVARFKAIEAGYTPKLQEAAALKQSYGEVDQLLAASEPHLKAQGWTKGTLVKAWLDVEKALAEDPVAQVAKIIEHYKVDPAKLAEKLGVNLGAAPQADTGLLIDRPYQDPVLSALQNQVKQLTEQLGGFTEAQKRQQLEQQQAKERETAEGITRFSQEKDETGQPKRPHFEKLYPAMIQLAQASWAMGKQPSLAEIYETAVWANPETREAMLALKAASAQASQVTAAKSKATAAKVAGSSVTGAPSGSGQAMAPASKGSVRADLLAAAEAAG